MEDKLFKAGGSEYITNLIKAACDRGEDCAVVTGNREISSAVRVPSDFTLILDGCHLRMADGCFDNMFVNQNHGTAAGKTTAGTDRNISILGCNGAVLDGGTYNGLSERTQLTNGMPPIWKNNLILFTNVDGFEISGLSCRNQRWWALNFVYCANGVLRDLDFKACDIGIDENGNIYHGLKRAKYEEVLVKNADGIDLRQGCHDIRIENITGFTEDDSVALTGLNGRLEKEFSVLTLCPDIYNISVRNIKTAAFCTNVRLLNQGDIKLHDIEIDGVYDLSAESQCVDRGIYAVRVGDTRLYGTRHSTAEETYNISIRNVRSRGAIAAIGLAGKINALVIENVECFDGAERMEDLR